MPADFVHLRVHSAYSLAEGAVRIPELVKLCQEHEMPAAAVTDTANLFGAMEFALAAAKGGVQPIIGCQLAILPDTDDTQDSVGAGAPHTDPASELVVLVQSEAGYRNLLHLVSHSFAAEDQMRRAQLYLSELSGHTDGLIALTGGVAGQVGRLLAFGPESTGLCVSSSSPARVPFLPASSTPASGPVPSSSVGFRSH